MSDEERVRERALPDRRAERLIGLLGLLLAIAVGFAIVGWTH